MKRRLLNSLILASLMAAMVSLSIPSALAQRGNGVPPPDSSLRKLPLITYHNGPIMTVSPDVYIIFYGCWGESCGSENDFTSTSIISEFVATVGGTPYFQINTTYTDWMGKPAAGSMIYGGSVIDAYSHGTDLKDSDLVEIVAETIAKNQLPEDPIGVYLVIGSSDVSADELGFCQTYRTPHHGYSISDDKVRRYAFIGNPARCPEIAAPQYVPNPWEKYLLSPNGRLGADAIVSDLAAVMNQIVTDPYRIAWFDSNGKENSAKCLGSFGNQYTTQSGAGANLHIGARDFLIQQNWVNTGVGFCGLQVGEEPWIVKTGN
jgi:hypothetical protein